MTEVGQGRMRCGRDTTGALARRRFRRYWTVVGAVSALLGVAALRRLAREPAPRRIEGEIVVARPPEIVFDAVADERREPEYNPDMLTVEKVTPGPIDVGTRFRAVHTGLRRPVAMDTVLTRYERPTRLSLASTMGWSDVEGTVTFEAVPGGTRMRWSWQVRTKGAYRLLGPLTTLVGGRQEAAVWAGLKRLLETGGSARGRAGG
jgi:uncharacterized protein YndB with AHSA1/START domain